MNDLQYRLDNSAKIWPALLSPRYTTWFRLFAVFTEPVLYEAARGAVSKAFNDHPYLAVRLKPGLFWYHLAPLKHPVDLQPDNSPPCMTYEGSRKTGPLVRVYAYRKTLAVEASHMVTDGTGLKVFFTTLLAEYTRLRRELLAAGPEVRESLVQHCTKPLPIPDPTHHRPETWEDSYVTHGIVDPPGARHRSMPKPDVPSKALHFPLALLPRGQYRISLIRYSAAAIRGRAKQYGISVGEYLESLVMLGFQRAAREAEQWPGMLPGRSRLSRPIRFLIPVDLRRLYNSRTMRNFFIGLPVEIDPRLGDFTLEEIIRRVHHAQRAELDAKYLRKQLARNARSQQSLMLRLVPLWLKDIVLRMVYRSIGDVRYTGSFSNLGRVSETVPGLAWVGFVPPPSPVNPINVTAITYGDELCLGFGKMTRVGRIEHQVVRAFAEQGLRGRLMTNFEGSTLWGGLQ
ncbi:hypothetical protein [Spirochaeta lutea]|uniref:Alcohol acetyltransferase n=1 Tax=Spirochaeta lutea TaxID=1480694 RepID=A0A098QV53_9SPIO|nr:hypothetical protein [Spirochaeta lutea]KGE71730.1 hypothetical protein DC28_10835 [Spirochaeta lutea]